MVESVGARGTRAVRGYRAGRRMKNIQTAPAATAMSAQVIGSTARISPCVVHTSCQNSSRIAISAGEFQILSMLSIVRPDGVQRCAILRLKSRVSAAFCAGQCGSDQFPARPARPGAPPFQDFHALRHDIDRR
jgi:hypothetical protein